MRSTRLAVARLFLLALAVAASGCRRDAAPAERAPTGDGIVSLDPCADQLLVTLAPSRRIAAISRASHDPALSATPPEVALRFRGVASAEDLADLNARLAITGPGTSPALMAALARAGTATVAIARPASLAAAKAQLMTVGAALDENEAARALADRIDGAVAAAHGRGAAIPALVLVAPGRASVADPLIDELLTRAGFANAAEAPGLPADGTVRPELFGRRPPRIVFAAAGLGPPAGFAQPVVSLPAAALRCAGPAVIELLSRFAEARDALRH